MTLTRSQRRRVLRRAARAWKAGKPHTAWSILAECGLSEYWPAFRNTALRMARQRYEREMSRF